jgi:hypothetical protein
LDCETNKLECDLFGFVFLKSEIGSGAYPHTIRRMAPKLVLGPLNGFDEQMFGAR